MINLRKGVVLNDAAAGNSTTQYMFLTVQAGTTTTVNNVKSSIVRYASKYGGTALTVSFPYAFPLNTWVHPARYKMFL
jgi:hypothetical protein